MVSKGCVFGKVIKESCNLFVPVAVMGCAEHRGSSEMEPSAQVATLGDFQTKIFQDLCPYFCAVSAFFFFSSYSFFQRFSVQLCLSPKFLDQ